MYIQFLGANGFRLQNGDFHVIVDPPGATTGLRQTALKADVALSSGFGDIDLSRVNPQNQDLFIIDHAGEYEIQGMFVYGLADNKSTFYIIEIDGVVVGHMAGLSSALPERLLEHLAVVDVLLLPVGGNDILSVKKAPDVVSQIEPRIVIPMDYSHEGYKVKRDGIELFIKEMGVKDVEWTDKVKIAKKDLPQEETKFVFLSP